MFFKVAEFNHVINNLNAQQELLKRQWKEGSISSEKYQEEQRRLSKTISAFTDNRTTALNEQRFNTNSSKF